MQAEEIFIDNLRRYCCSTQTNYNKWNSNI